MRLSYLIILTLFAFATCNREHQFVKLHFDVYKSTSDYICRCLERFGISKLYFSGFTLKTCDKFCYSCKVNNREFLYPDLILNLSFGNATLNDFTPFINNKLINEDNTGVYYKCLVT